MGIIETFIDWLPYSLLIFVLPVLAYWLLKPSAEEKEIRNRVEIFFKGGTKGYYDCTVNNDMIQFRIGESEFNEPIIEKPRIEYAKGEIRRTYMFAEGIVGTVEVPSLSDEKKEEIIGILKERKIISPNDTKDEYSDDELLEYVAFYQFDIDHVTYNPQMKNFAVTMNATGHLINGIVKGLKNLESDGGLFRTFLILVLGAILGFFVGYALTLKGVI